MTFKKKILIPLFLFIILLIPNIYGTCSCSTIDKTYVEGEIITYDCNCSLVTEKNKPYNMSFYSVDGSYKSSYTGTTPSVVQQEFLISYTIPDVTIDDPGLWSANLSVNAVYKAGYLFNVTNLSTDVMLISISIYPENISIGMKTSLTYQLIKAVDSGAPIVNAFCDTAILDPHFHVIDGGKIFTTSGNGYATFIFDTTDYEKKNHETLIGKDLQFGTSCVCYNCTDPSIPGCCLNGDTGEYYKQFLRGDALIPFNVVGDITRQTDDSVSTLAMIFACLILTITYIVFGFINFKYKIANFDSKSHYIYLLCFSLSGIELIFMLGLLYGNYVGVDLTDLLKINFYVNFILMLLVIFATIIITMATLFASEKDVFGEDRMKWEGSDRK